VTIHTSRSQFASVTPEQFTQALANAASGVNVVTTDGPGGKAGLTVSSMCSVCAEPPVILACVSADNEFCDAAKVNGHFAINLLNTNQVDLAKVFAGLSDSPESDRFDYGEWTTLTTGSPVLHEALVSLDCDLSVVHAHGTHLIYVGRVVDVVSQSKDALVYCLREFRQTARLG